MRTHDPVYTVSLSPRENVHVRPRTAVTDVWDIVKGALCVCLYGLIALLLLLLSGCAPLPPMQFSKAGMGTPELRYDLYECQVQWDRSASAIAAQTTPFLYLDTGEVERTALQRCLEHRGWTRVDHE